jgi:hypothetical protein
MNKNKEKDEIFLKKHPEKFVEKKFKQYKSFQ